jgi:hypothetical protein
MPVATESQQATMPWQLKTFALVDGRKDDPRYKAEGLYQQLATLEMRLIRDDREAALVFAALDQAEAGVLDQLEAVRKAFTKSEPYRQLVNLRKGLAEADANRAAAGQKAKDALARVGTALAKDQDPTAFEEVGRLARIDEEIAANRVAACKKLISDAETKAKAMLRELLESKRQELLALAKERRDSLQAKLVALVTEQMGPLAEANRVVMTLDPELRRRQYGHGDPRGNLLKEFCELP